MIIRNQQGQSLLLSFFLASCFVKVTVVGKNLDIMIISLHFFIFFLTSSCFCNFLKCAFHVCSIFCWGFKELNISMRFTPLLSLRVSNLLYLIKCNTFLSEALSSLFPRTTNGKFSGSLGYPYIRNSSLQLSSESNDWK